MINQKEEELNTMLIKADMKETLDLEEKKEEAHSFGEMEQFMLDNLKEDLCKVMEYIIYQMEKFMKESLEKIEGMVMENLSTL